MIHDPVCSVKCKGRDAEGREPLEEPVDVKVHIKFSTGYQIIALRPECLYNAGTCQEFCKASGHDSTVLCVYSVDVPSVKDCLARANRT